MSTYPVDIYERLLQAFGHQDWWPGDSPFEVMVGAVLTQNTSWKNVEKAIDNLRDADCLRLADVHRLKVEELAELIRPAGYYRLKARRLKNLIDFVADRYDGSLEAMFAVDVSQLREELLGINGIGPETADSILLYAGDLLSFVVDNYTARVLKRHGWIEPEADYYAIQDFLASSLPDDVQLYNEFHALFVRVGNSYCRKTPQCDQCPLNELLPESGIVDL